MGRLGRFACGWAAPKPGNSSDAVELGHLGGLKGNKARTEKLSTRKRKAIEKKAAEAQYNKAEK